MRDRLVGLIGQRRTNYFRDNRMTMCESIADILLANGVIHIPCKIGDIVYQTDGLRIYELTILDISLRKNKPYYETESIDFDDDAFGKSIFLTKEESERALKGGEG